MKRAVLIALLPGCYLGVRGGIDRPLEAPANVEASPQGALDLGLGGSDDLQSGAIMMGFAASPMVGRERRAETPRMTLITFGGRYERAFTRAHPGVRGFGRLMLGGNLCGESTESSTMEPDPSCASEAQRRSISLTSVALGVAFTTTQHGEDDELVPMVGTVGLAIVYSYATDDALGAADFLGVEVSVGIGGDLLTPLTRRDDH